MTNNLINIIRNSKKRTPAVLLYRASGEIISSEAEVFGDCIIVDEIQNIERFLFENKQSIISYRIFCDRRNSAVPLIDVTHLNARIEPGAAIREGAEIGTGAVIMMGAIVNIGAKIGSGTMVDMNAVIGAGAVIESNCHIGAGAVIAGTIEPPSAVPARVCKGVMIGANAVVLEGITVGENAAVAAGSVVIKDVPKNAVVAGVPAEFIKYRDKKTDGKTEIVEALREL